MSQPNVYKTVTVTPPLTATSLLSLLQAVDATIGTVAGAAYREVNLQADPGNAGTNNIFVGDDTLSAARIGIVLTPGTPRNYRSSGATADIPLSNFFVMAAVGTPKLNVELLM